MCSSLSVRYGDGEFGFPYALLSAVPNTLDVQRCAHLVLLWYVAVLDGKLGLLSAQLLSEKIRPSPTVYDDPDSAVGKCCAGMPVAERLITW